jgi:nitronate monooxygenase
MRARFLAHTGARYPIIGGAMYQISSPHLVAHMARAGILGEIQPVSFTFTHRTPLPEAFAMMREIAPGPYGINVLVEGTEEHRRQGLAWLDIALSHGCRFITTALGKPTAVVERAREHGAVVYHKVTTLGHAQRAIEAGVDGLIAVNSRAGGHAGPHTKEELFAQLSPFGVPLVCAGGIGDEDHFCDALALGYAGVLMGTRFIASTEAPAPEPYKRAIIRASEDDVISTTKVQIGVPLAVIRTPGIARLGTTFSPVEQFMLRTPNRKRWLRRWYSLASGQPWEKIKKGQFSEESLWSAGKSVATITAVESISQIVERFVARGREVGVL